ncbi:MAG: lysophospholipid acyltransferase family protein [Treponema sp.]
MYSFITLCCLFSCLALPAVSNIIAYPVSIRLSRAISQYIVKRLAPRVFAILNCYRNFKFFGDNDSKKLLPAQFIIISNHQSLFDIPAYMNFLRDKELRFVAKDNLSRHIPLVSEMLRAQEHCMIPRRGSPMEAMKVVENFAKRALEKNQIPVLFPEGTRTRDGNVGKFYSAGFRKLSEAANLPVAVCALDGGWQIRDMANIMRRLKNGSYRVKVLKVFPAPKTKDAQAALLEESRALIQAQIDEWRKLPASVR